MARSIDYFRSAPILSGGENKERAHLGRRGKQGARPSWAAGKTRSAPILGGGNYCGAPVSVPAKKGENMFAELEKQREAKITAGQDARAPYSITAGQDARAPYSNTAGQDARAPYSNTAGQDARAPALAPQMKFLKSDEKIATTRHHLPHWAQNGVAYFITFRLADSLPKVQLARWRQEREAYLSQCENPLTPGQEEEYHKRFSGSIDRFLDAGSGSCSLRYANIAKIVSDAIQHFDGKRYLLYSFVVMPNHLHVLFSLRENEKLPNIVHSWKSYTAKLINKELGRIGAFWQEDYWDRIIRSQKHFNFVCKYISENPQKAKLKGNEFLLWSAGILPGE
jgi:REP element-mobilizing transposase RayT